MATDIIPSGDSSLVTIESLRLAARANNEAGGNMEKRKSLLVMLDQKDRALQKQDTRRWRRAHQMALNLKNPKRLALYDIYDDAMLDMHLTGCVQQRFAKTLLKKFVIKDAEGNEDETAARCFESQWFYDFLLYALESHLWGHSLIQLGDVITDARGCRRFSEVQLVPRRHVVPEYGVLLRDPSDEPEKGIPFREGPLSLWCVEVGKPTDLGLLLKCAPHCLSKRHMAAYWDTFGEIFGMPMRVATTTSQNPGDRIRIQDMLESMGAAGWALFPEGTTIDIKESTRGDAYNVYDKRMDRCNSEISKGILVQTMTLDSGSSLSQSETHLEMFKDLCASDAVLFKNVINDRLIPLMIRHGFDLEGRFFDWDDAATYSPAEQRELERMLLQYFDVDPQYFIDKYKIPITGARQQGDGSFFE